MALGRMATTTLIHRLTVSIRSQDVRFLPPRLNGQSLGKYNTTTARIAPSWMTTLNIVLNASLICS